MALEASSPECSVMLMCVCGAPLHTPLHLIPLKSSGARQIPCISGWASGNCVYTGLQTWVRSE